jgi:hypothetical protein
MSQVVVLRGSEAREADETLEAARALLEPIAQRIVAMPPDARQRFAIYLHCLAEVCGAGLEDT